LYLVDLVKHFDVHQSLFDLLIRKLLEGINVFADGVHEDKGKLRDEREITSQFFQGQLTGVPAVQKIASSWIGFDKAIHSLNERRFP
jgi:hypothetical protein